MAIFNSFLYVYQRVVFQMAQLTAGSIADSGDFFHFAVLGLFFGRDRYFGVSTGESFLVILFEHGEITIWWSNVAIGDTPFLADFPIKTSIYRGFSIATTEYRRVLVIFLVAGSVVGDIFLWR